MTTLTPDLQQKIERRARRAFRALDAGDPVKHHRITEVTPISLKYRLSHRFGGYGARRYDGPQLTITRDAAGVITVPAGSHKGLTLDLRVEADLRRLKDGYVGLVRAYKATTQEGKGTQYPTAAITYKPGAELEEPKAVTDPYRDCAAGINLATLEWAKGESERVKGRLFACEFDASDLAAIPNRGTGKFRVFRCKVIEEVETDGTPKLSPPDDDQGGNGLLKRLLGK